MTFIPNQSEKQEQIILSPMVHLWQWSVDLIIQFPFEE